MTVPPRRLFLALGVVFLPSFGRAQAIDAPVTARQVSLLGVVATPGDLTTDPRLNSVAPQLRKLFPNNGFRLLDVRTKRLAPGQTVTCTLQSGYTASTTLVQPADENGKVQLVCSVSLNKSPQLETRVSTPPNQLFFCEKLLPSGQRLLLGVGAR